MIDIVITTWQREWMTDLCLQAIRANTQTPYRLIVIDNGSNLNAKRKYLSEGDIYVKLDQNYGLERAKHIGMSFVQSPLFISMDNDILVFKLTPDWLSQLVDLMDRHPDYGAIALRPQQLVGTSMSMFDTDSELVDFPHVPGYGRIMRTEWVKEVGSWGDERPLRGHEEMWIGQKFAEKGYKLAWANKIGCWHLWGREDTDMWGYPKDSTPEEHGHNPVWPIAKNDRAKIAELTGITEDRLLELIGWN